MSTTSDEPRNTELEHLVSDLMRRMRNEMGHGDSVPCSSTGPAAGLLLTPTKLFEHSLDAEIEQERQEILQLRSIGATPEVPDVTFDNSLSSTLSKAAHSVAQAWGGGNDATLMGESSSSPTTNSTDHNDSSTTGHSRAAAITGTTAQQVGSADTNPSSTTTTTQQPLLTNQQAVLAVGKWSVEEVGDWVREKGLGDYSRNFVNNGVDGRSLLNITKLDLKEELHITILQDRKDIWAAILSLKEELGLIEHSTPTEVLHHSRVGRGEGIIHQPPPTPPPTTNSPEPAATPAGGRAGGLTLAATPSSSYQQNNLHSSNNNNNKKRSAGNGRVAPLDSVDLAEFQFQSPTTASPSTTSSPNTATTTTTTTTGNVLSSSLSLSSTQQPTTTTTQRRNINNNYHNHQNDSTKHQHRHNNSNANNTNNNKQSTEDFVYYQSTDVVPRRPPSTARNRTSSYQLLDGTSTTELKTTVASTPTISTKRVTKISNSTTTNNAPPLFPLNSNSGDGLLGESMGSMASTVSSYSRSSGGGAPRRKYHSESAYLDEALHSFEARTGRVVGSLDRVHNL
eukprot:TRINITY_DN67889_c5_g1_i1.p1 TRINITY_DN67889_c5_g1~~TRINITY_DN67889_c5_g1_i1.p1  ORF type:complete len:566 (-),score=95.70 TRINITY_DN67889_c5_g1_i1:211-1908(-)